MTREEFIAVHKPFLEGNILVLEVPCVRVDLLSLGDAIYEKFFEIRREIDSYQIKVTSLYESMLENE
jgi:hypothetical protein